MSLYFIPKYKVPNEMFPLLKQDEKTNIDVLSNLSGQIRQLTALLEIPPEEFDERRAVCAEVLQTLRKFYPDSSLIMYGSSVNSLGFKRCLLDLFFLPFPSYCNLDYMKKDINEAEKERTPIPTPASILSGEISNDVLTKFDEYTHLKFIRNVLRHEKVGKRSSFVPAGKCPSLKVDLNNSKLTCNISASNRLVVFNSELLQFFEKLDERVKPLVICLRYWARSLGLIKRSFFSSYSFTLLVIFFLQSVSSPILPSVQRLFEISDTSRMTVGWQTAFTTDVESVPKSKNTKTVGELLIEFFKFYFHFDYSRYAVSPHSGKPLLIDDIKNSTDDRMAEFEFTALNVQDVFILSRNVCKIEKLAVFKLALLTAHDMLTGTEKVEFHTLFDSNAYQRTLDNHYYKHMSGRPQVCFIHYDYECMKKFDCLQSWYEKASEAVYEVLQYGLLMECEVTDKVCSWKKKDRTAPHRNNNNNNSKEKIFTETPSTPYDLQLLLSMQCVLYSRTWIGRKNAEASSSQEDLDDECEVFTSNVLTTEHCISKSVVNKNPSLNCPVPVLCFRCECYRHVNPEFKDLVVLLKPLSISREFYQLSAFLTSFIPKTIKKILISE